MSRRNKPHDPAKAIQARLERAEREREAERLRKAGATVTQDRTGRIVSAYRSNVFNLLLQRKSIQQHHYSVASELCELWAEWKGMDGKREGSGEFVDNGRSEPDKRILVSDRMIRAGRRVVAVMEALNPVNRVLVERLVTDTVEQDRPRPWRLQVQEAIGVEARDRQVEAVRKALDDLAHAMQQPVARRAA